MNDELSEALGDFDHALAQLAKAYPLSVFPEPDLKAAHAALQAAGMTLDAVSASNMRHVATTLNADFDKVRALVASAEEGDRKDAARLRETLELVRNCSSQEWQTQNGARMGATDNQGRRMWFFTEDVLQEVVAALHQQEQAK
jgi:hypothetical protein